MYLDVGTYNLQLEDTTKCQKQGNTSTFKQISKHEVYIQNCESLN